MHMNMFYLNSASRNSWTGGRVPGGLGDPEANRVAATKWDSPERRRPSVTLRVRAFSPVGAHANSSHSFMNEKLVGTEMRASRISGLTLIVAVVLSGVMASPFVAMLSALPGETSAFSSSGGVLSGHALVQPGPKLVPAPLRGASEASGRPLLLLPYTVNVTEAGLPAGTHWGAEIDGAPSVSGSGRSLQFSEFDGTHQLAILPPQGYLSEPPFESFTVSGAAVSLSIPFTPVAANPFSTGMPASLALGQSNLTATTASSPTNSSNLFPWLSAFDSHGDLWVSDLSADRVLEFVPPFHTGMTASLVLGQSNFTNNGPGVNASNLTRPEGVAFNSAGDIWVASEGSGRVTEFRPPFSNGMNASLIIGQAAFGGPSTVGSGPTNLSGPVGISFDASGDLWVAEFLNNRVTEFRPPFSDGEAASIALGQSTLTGNQGNTTAVNLSAPQAIQFDAHGDAWVSDWNNARALEYLAPLSTGEAASVVLGQPDFTTAGSTGPNSFGYVGTLLLDSHGDVWEVDYSLNRVVEFVGPTFANYEAPTIVIGQPNLTTTASEGGAVGLQNPQGAVFDSAGNLWVDDIGDHRVLEFVAAAPASTSSSGSSSSSNLVWIVLVIVVAVIAVVEAVLLVRRPGKPSAAPGGPAQWAPSAPTGGAAPPPPPPPPASPPSVPPGAV